MRGPVLALVLVAGPAKVQLAVQALDPGTYKFTCKVHPNMAGALVVGG
jgi:plastocyanin